MTDKVASTKQIELLEKLLTEHQLYSGDFERLWKMLEAHRIDERTPGDGSPIAMAHASQIIRWLLQVVKDPTAMKRWS